jgi:hypothetical protein
MMAGVESWELIVREQVRETIARYAHAVDGGRLAELAGCFAPDGVLEIKGEPAAHGRPAIIELLRARPAAGGGAGPAEAERAPAGGGTRPAGPEPNPGYIRHHVTNVLISEVTPRSAQAASYFLVVIGSGPDRWGRYRDRLVPWEGTWLFARRRVTFDGRGPVPSG